MALTTTQVNSAYLAVLARPAEGKAATWASASTDTNDLMANITLAQIPATADFVETLYDQVIGRPSDAEGKIFWSAVYAANGAKATLEFFTQTVLAAGAADASNADFQGFIAQSKVWVKDLYKNLLNDEAPDEEGVTFWTNALATGTTQGDLLNAFIQSAQSDPNSDHAQTLNAKLAVADAVTAAFSDYSSTLSAAEKKAGAAALVSMMAGVTAGSTVEDFQDQIAQFVGNNQNLTTSVFTKEKDALEGSETAATTFQGTVNLVTPANSTATSDDSATGAADYVNTLKINVVSDKNHNILDLGELPNTTNVSKLVVNNGTAKITGELGGTANGFTDSAVFAGTGDVDLKISGAQKALSVGTGAKGESIISVDGANAVLNNYTGGEGADSVEVKATGTIGNADAASTIDLGGGNDSLTIASGAEVKAETAIKLGAGKDNLTISTTITKTGETDNQKSTVTLDGGNGTEDTLALGSSNVIGVKSITGFETLDASGATISAIAANGLKTTLTNDSDLIITADKAVSTIDLKNISVENPTNAKGSATINITDVTNQTIVLSGTGKNISETVKLSNAAEAKYNAVITKFAKKDAKAGITGDKIAFNGVASSVEIIDTTDEKYKDDGLKGNNFAQTMAALKAIQAKLGTVEQATAKQAFVISDSQGSHIWVVENAKAASALEAADLTYIAYVDAKFKEDDNKTDFFDVTVPGVALTFDLNVQTLDLAGTDQEYNGIEFKDAIKVIMNEIKGGKLTISGDTSATVKTVDAFITSDNGSVENKAAYTAASVNVYLGGSENASGAITADTTGSDFAVNLTGTGAANVYVNTESKLTFAANANFGGKAIDLKGKATAGDVKANIAITELSATSSTEADLTALFTSGAATDTIAATLASTVKSVKLTEATETVKLNAASAGVNITNATTADLIDFSARSANLTGTDSKAVAWVGNGTSANTKDKLAFMTTTETNITALTKDKFGSGAKFANNNDSTVVAVSSTSDGKELTAFYLVSAGAAATTVNNVSLIATINIETANADKLGIADTTHIVSFLD